MGIKEIATERTVVAQKMPPQRRQIFALFTANIISSTGSVLTVGDARRLIAVAYGWYRSNLSTERTK
jgi:hypothetical protein